MKTLLSKRSDIMDQSLEAYSCGCACARCQALCVQHQCTNCGTNPIAQATAQTQQRATLAAQRSNSVHNSDHMLIWMDLR
jgi:hypothetical protein